MAEQGGIPDQLTGRLENTVISLQKYVDTTTTTLRNFKRLNRVLALLILMVLGSYGFIFYKVLSNNFNTERLLEAAQTQTPILVSEVKTEVEQFVKTRRPELEKKISAGAKALFDRFQEKVTYRLDKVHREITEDATETLQGTLDQIAADQKRLLQATFPDLLEPGRLEHLANELQVNALHANQEAIDLLHHRYAERLDDIKTKVETLGRRKFHMDSQDLEAEVIHYGLLLVDREYLRYHYAKTGNDWEGKK